MRGPNDPAPLWIPYFPSDKHHDQLKAKGFNGRVLDTELWAWMSYNYAWRRVLLNAFDDRFPLDPSGDWFNAPLVAQAQAFYATKFNGRSRRR
jgi:hypothetical protein